MIYRILRLIRNGYDMTDNNNKILKSYKDFLKKKRKRKTGDSLLPTTIDAYMKIAKKLLKNWPIDNIYKNSTTDEKVIEQYAQFFIDSNLGTNVFSATRSFLKFLGYDIRTMPLTHPYVRTALKSKRLLQSKVLEEEEVALLINSLPEELELHHPEYNITYNLTIKQDELELIILLLYYGALRRKELCGIRPIDVNYETCEIKILGKGHKKGIAIYPKSVINKLNDYIIKHGIKPADKIFYYTYTSKSGKVKPYRKQLRVIWSIIKLLGIQILGRDNVTPHCLRHSRATHLADRGADILGLKATLRHEDIRTTQIYIQVSKHQIRQTFEKYGNYEVGG
jgi:site-specific recombinase XerD